MLRGNNGEDIFFTDEDRCKLALLLQEGTERFGHRIHAFCFMSNHLHLALQSSQIPISKIVHNFSFRYSSHINRKYDRVGHIFQGRFKSILLDEEGYLKSLIRYIHLNPIRAGLTKKPQDYRWSSHQCYLNLSENDFPWTTTHVVLNKFGQDYPTAVKKYILHHSEQDQEADKLFRQGNYEGTLLGDQEFIEQISNSVLKPKFLLKSTISITDLIKTICHHFSISQQELITGKSQKTSRMRAILSILTNQLPGLTLEILAIVLHRDASTLSSLIRRYGPREKLDPSFAHDLQAIREILFQ